MQKQQRSWSSLESKWELESPSQHDLVEQLVRVVHKLEMHSIFAVGAVHFALGGLHLHSERI